MLVGILDLGLDSRGESAGVSAVISPSCPLSALVGSTPVTGTTA
jgi:hypothetical protein